MVVWLPAYKNMNNPSMRSIFVWQNNDHRIPRKLHVKTSRTTTRALLMANVRTSCSSSCSKWTRNFPSSICSSSLLFVSRTVRSPIRWTKSSSTLLSDLSTSSPREHYVYGKVVRVRQCKAVRADTYTLCLSVQWPPTTGHAHRCHGCTIPRVVGTRIMSTSVPVEICLLKATVYKEGLCFICLCQQHALVVGLCEQRSNFVKVGKWTKV